MPWRRDGQAPRRSAEFRKPVYHNVGCRVGHGIGRPGGSPLVGPAHKGGAIADAAGRIEVEIVARHHQDLARLDGEKCGGAPINIGVQLVDAQHLAADDGVPIDAVAARCIDDQPQAEGQNFDVFGRPKLSP